MTAHALIDAIRQVDTVARLGTVTRIMPTFIEADGPGVPLGSLCRIRLNAHGGDRPSTLLAEVAKVETGRITLAPYGPVSAAHIGDTVEALRVGASFPVGPNYLGRIVDPMGVPLDGGAAVDGPLESWPLAGAQTPALDRLSPRAPLETGLRTIDALLTLGIGQRVGIFAGSGVGKTTLLADLASHVQADVCVLCLVGERGREADDFWQHALTEQARQRSVMVVATSDQPAILRARSVLVALSLAEYFRAQGKHVLLLLDSITRYALALREIGLAAGEPPTLRAYTPSVFSALPKVIERCGALRHGGAITALMTVLAETDDIDDPMTETLRALLDGHIVLTRALAEQGHYPAIDVPRSISRVFGQVTGAEHRAAAKTAIAQLSLYETSRTLVESGLYSAGSNAQLDRALRTRPALIDFLRQESGQGHTGAQSIARLHELVGGAKP
ncbi:FliI/YscN family ATPase [Lysobacter gummosus]|uniref:protein-secreting ATPase n=1 Tax=Lysobacter gummosus TaxID=262324 RepID=A0ABY3XC12_9GAMM|nr:FliI/YscN family ATPase [Lysobacter gummosus]ALN93528.1 flagellum-specific ATP synthase [Lysobacter gummosus]UNP28976.1 FliI/YscN family ATPase [Lysobacter gummosus]